MLRQYFAPFFGGGAYLELEVHAIKAVGHSQADLTLAQNRGSPPLREHSLSAFCSIIVGAAC